MADNPHDSLLGKIAAYTEILATDPRSTIFVSLSEAYRKMGMLDDAATVAEGGLSYLPDYCPGHVVLARIKCQQGDMSGSAASFEKALEIDSQSLAALVGFSRLCLLQERKADARNLLLKARDLSPADPVINKLLLGLPEVEQPSVVPEPVIPESEPVVDQKDSQPEPSALNSPEPLESATLADLYLKQGLADKALEIFRNLLARDPDNLDFRRRIRDLESTTTGLTDYPASPPEVSDPADIPAPDLSDSEPAPAPAPAEVHSDTPAGETDPVEELSALEQLNRILTSIQKRRGDVQGHA